MTLNKKRAYTFRYIHVFVHWPGIISPSVPGLPTLKRKKTGAAGNPAAPLLFFIMINDDGTFVNRKVYKIMKISLRIFL